MLETILAALLLGQDRQEQWPQWRGPHANGIAPKADPPTEWSETKNIHGPAFEVLATNKLSEGADASPVLVGKQLYLRGAKHLYCIESR